MFYKNKMYHAIFYGLIFIIVVLLAMVCNFLNIEGDMRNANSSMMEKMESVQNQHLDELSKLRVEHMNKILTLEAMHKAELLEAKIRERGKRFISAIPIAGTVAMGWFEKIEYDEWKADNPNGTPVFFYLQTLLCTHFIDAHTSTFYKSICRTS